MPIAAKNFASLATAGLCVFDFVLAALVVEAPSGEGEAISVASIVSACYTRFFKLLKPPFFSFLGSSVPSLSFVFIFIFCAPPAMGLA